jgi:hypothetical protein
MTTDPATRAAEALLKNFYISTREMMVLTEINYTEEIASILRPFMETEEGIEWERFYRLLNDGELIKPDDEIYCGFKQHWEKALGVSGSHFDPAAFYPVRRRLHPNQGIGSYSNLLEESKRKDEEIATLNTVCNKLETELINLQAKMYGNPPGDGTSLER